MTTPYTLKHFQIALAAFFVALGLGTLAFWAVMREDAFSSFYRATVTISLTGIDTKPHTHGGQVVTILVILAGMAIYGYLASAIVELIAHGVLSGVLTERRRTRVIRGLRDHYIICGYGRVGRRVGQRVPRRRRPVHRSRLDARVEALRRAGPDPLRGRDGDTRRGSRSRRARPCEGARRLQRLGRRQPLHRRLGAGNAAGPLHRRARLHRGRRAQDVAGRRRPRRPAVHGRRAGDGEARAEAGGGGVPRHRHERRWPRPADGGDRDHRALRQRRASRSATSTSAATQARSSSRCASRTGASTRPRAQTR